MPALSTLTVVIAPAYLLQDPEANAMIQAFYSRSKRGIVSRLADLDNDLATIKERLKDVYLGYGHDSVAQTGFVTLFLEEVSLLAAKAVQDNDLYNGQESSTRYLPFGGDEPTVLDMPGIFNDEGGLLKKWIELYDRVFAACMASLQRRHCQGLAGEELVTAKKACKLKAFDVARGWLPAGVTTNLSWTCSLDTFNREMPRLLAHPLTEVNLLAVEMHRQMMERYPSSIKPLARLSQLAEDYKDQEDLMSPEEDYCLQAKGYRQSYFRFQVTNLLSARPLKEGVDLSSTSKKKKYARLSRRLHTSAHIQLTAELDFGSFRDVQRHRTLHIGCQPAILHHRFSAVYYEALAYLLDNKQHEWEPAAAADPLIQETGLLMRELEVLRHSLDSSDKRWQYVMPLGIACVFTANGYLGDWIYFLERRSGETVHFTVQHLVDAVWGGLNAWQGAWEDPLRRNYARQGLDPAFWTWLSPSIDQLPEFKDLLSVSVKRAGQDILVGGKAESETK